MGEPYTVTVRQATELTGLSKRKVYELAESGAVKRIYPHNGTRNYVLVWSSVKEWLDRQPTEPANP